MPTRSGNLLLGDCLDLLPKVDSASVDLILTDLPYATTRNGWDSLIDPERLWPEMLRVLRPGGAIAMTAQQPFTSALVTQQPRLFRHSWVWEKTHATGHLNAKRAPMKAHEDVLVFARKQPTYNPQKTTGHVRKSANRSKAYSGNYGLYGASSYDSTERYPRSVITFASDKQRVSLHPTQKPVALFEYMIRTYSNEGDLVLDVAAGSGTTAIAAENTGRRWLCMEKDPSIHAAASQRITAELVATS